MIGWTNPKTPKPQQPQIYNQRNRNSKWALRNATAKALSRSSRGRDRGNQGAVRARDEESQVTLGCARHRARGPRSPRAFVLELVLSPEGRQRACLKLIRGFIKGRQLAAPSCLHIPFYLNTSPLSQPSAALTTACRPAHSALSSLACSASAVAAEAPWTRLPWFKFEFEHFAAVFEHFATVG